MCVQRVMHRVVQVHEAAVKKAYDAMPYEAKAAAWSKEKSRIRAQRDSRAAHKHYFFPGLRTNLQYAHGMDGNLRRMTTWDLSTLIRRNPAVADWYNVSKPKTMKLYIEAFCRANHLIL